MVYNKEKAIEAWKTFVNSGVIIDNYVRPEIGRSWIRCRSAGVNPWSTHFAEQNAALLEEKRSRYADSLRSNTPVMKFLMALLGCNVSLMDGENFVFELMSPLMAYPRTYGTFVREEDVGTGNATVVAYEKKPIRCEGFEQYRAISQTYSGVSAPYLDADGRYFGALNVNNPFATLPESALELCTKAVDLASELHRAGARDSALLSTVEFFRPLLMLYEDPVVLVDLEGHVLSASPAMRQYCPDWEDFSYGSQALDAYLGKKESSKDILSLPERLEVPVPTAFRTGRSRAERILNLVRRRTVDLEGQDPFVMLVFEGESKASEQKLGIGTKRFVEYSTAADEPIDYIGETAAWKTIDDMVQRVAPIKANVLLLGETGTGKEVVARALHRRSGRKGEFVAINCGAVPRDLLATELFGYEGGAFTGAREAGAVGKFEFADGGTLFLDEIGEMPIDMQVSLLRVLQEQSVTKLGSNVPRALDVRVVAATNQDIEQLISEKKFRSDLYYRLSLVEMRLPQLRRRADDVPLLVDYFNKSLSSMLNLPCTPFPPSTLEAFRQYSWPGNVRELRNMVERSLIMQGEGARVLPDTLPPHIANAVNLGALERTDSPSADRIYDGPLSEGPSHILSGKTETSRALDDDRRAIVEAIERHEGNLSLAASDLGMSSSTLRRRLDRLGLRVRVIVEEVPSR